MESITVKIFGENYTVKTAEDSRHVEEVAKHVDEKMKEIAGSGKVITTDKIAILAALNIADEFFKSKREWISQEEATGEKIEALLAVLRKVLPD